MFLQLPNIEQAVIDPAKLRGYLLSPRHPVGRFKAVFFESLGYSLADWERLGMDLREQHLGKEAMLGGRTKYGQKYVIRGRIIGPNGRLADLVSIWIMLLTEDFPRFITAYPGGGR